MVSSCTGGAAARAAARTNNETQSLCFARLLHGHGSHAPRRGGRRACKAPFQIAVTRPPPRTAPQGHLALQASCALLESTPNACLGRVISNAIREFLNAPAVARCRRQGLQFGLLGITPKRMAPDCGGFSLGVGGMVVLHWNRQTTSLRCTRPTPSGQPECDAAENNARRQRANAGRASDVVRDRRRHCGLMFRAGRGTDTGDKQGRLTQTNCRKSLLQHADGAMGQIAPIRHMGQKRRDPCSARAISSRIPGFASHGPRAGSQAMLRSRVTKQRAQKQRISLTAVDST